MDKRYLIVVSPLKPNNLRLLIFIFFCLIARSTIGQTCQTYNNRIINCIDKDSLKQGFWYEYIVTKIMTNDSFRRNPNVGGFHNESGEIHMPKAEGFYKDNKRIGEWIFYVGSFYNDGYPPTSHTKQITFTDTGYFFEVDTFWHFSAKVSNDTNNLTGILTLKDHGVEINCKKKTCYLNNPFKNNEKEEFPYRDLEDKLWTLNFYDKRKVKTLE